MAHDDARTTPEPPGLGNGPGGPVATGHDPVFMAIAELQDEEPEVSIAEVPPPSAVTHGPNPDDSSARPAWETDAETGEATGTGTTAAAAIPLAPHAPESPVTHDAPAGFSGFAPSLISPTVRPDAPAHAFAPAPAPARAEGPSALRTLLVPAIVGLAAGFVGASLAGRPAETEPDRPRITAPAETADAKEAGDPGGAPGIDALRAQLDRLEGQVDKFGERLDEKSNVSALEALQVHVEDLARTSHDVGTLPDRLTALSTTVEGLSGDLGRLRGELATLRSRVERDRAAAAEPPRPATAPAPATETAGATESDDQELKKGIELFLKGQFKDALGIANRLQLGRPDDARVWYLAALVQGFATKQWYGLTQRLAEKGVEREAAGTPKADQIDAAFRDLTTASGKDWLARYRARARAH